MINTDASSAVNSIIDLVPVLQEESCNNVSLNGFDDLLSNLLNEITDSKKLDEKTEISAAAFHSVLLGTLLISSDVIRNNAVNTKDELQAFDSTQINGVVLKPMPKIQQQQNLTDEVGNSNGIVGFENLTKSKTSCDKGALEIYKSAFLQSESGILSSMPNENPIIKLTGEGIEGSYELAPDNLGKMNHNLNDKYTTKKDIQIEQNNPDIAVKDVLKEINIKTISDGKNSDFSFDDLYGNNSFKLSRSDDDETEVNKIIESKKIFDFYVYQGDGPAVGDSDTAIIDKKNKLTQAIEKQIVKNATFIEQNGKKEFEIRLKPDFLGRIVIKLQNGEDGINVRISTSNIDVKEILSAQFPQLQETLRTQGIDLQNAEVVYTGLANSGQDFTGDSGYRSSNKKSISQVKGEYECAIISGASGPIQEMPINYNSAVNYLV